jgi:hypothetical protein
MEYVTVISNVSTKLGNDGSASQLNLIEQYLRQRHLNGVRLGKEEGETALGLDGEKVLSREMIWRRKACCVKHYTTA